MSIPVYSDLDFQGGAGISGLPQATAPGEPLTFEQLSTALEGLAWKDDVRAASLANINLAAPGATIDGVTMALNDRFLAKDQTAGAQNGIYIWNGASAAAARAPDMNLSAEFNSAVVTVSAGAENGGKTWRQTAANPTVGTTPIVFSGFATGAPPASESTAGIAEFATQAEVDAGSDATRTVSPATLAAWAGRARRFSADVGDASNTAFVLTHNLGTRDVVVVVRRNSGAYEQVLVDSASTSTNTVTLTFATAPAVAQFRATVIG